MAIRIVQLGTPRSAGEGLRLGTVRRPPRGVPKAEFASRDFYDVWLPILSPGPELMKQAQTAVAERNEKAWHDFIRHFRAEMEKGDASKVLDMLAALSHQTDLALGCYCADETHCHRSVLRTLLIERGAKMTASADA
jgi:uncharacterized protein YeaO (DUF488 family)